MNFDILFSIMALREIEFFSRAARRLREAGYGRVGFITFHEAGDRMLEKENIPYFSMHKLTDKEVVRPVGDELAEKLERRYTISAIRSLFIHDRFTLNRPDEARLIEKTARYLAALDRIFEENRVRCVMQELGGFVANQTVYYASKRAGVPHVFIEPSMYRGRILFTDSMFADIPVDQPVSDQAKQESGERWNAYLESRAVNIPAKDVHHFADMGLSKLLAAGNWRKLSRKVYHKYISREREEYNAIGFTVMGNFKKFLRRQVLGRMYQQPVPGEKYVYYPLHVPHDFQLFVRSPEFVNQEALIEYIGRCLPYGYKLYIKEHPAAIGAHPLWPTRSFLRAQNTKLIHPGVNSYDLIKNAACVVTVNSKVGVEALMQLRPVVVLGKAFYRGQGITHDVESLGDLDQVMRRAIHQPPDPDCVGDFLARVYAATYPGELYVQSNEKAQEFADSLVSFLQSKVEIHPVS